MVGEALMTDTVDAIRNRGFAAAGAREGAKPDTVGFLYKKR